MIVSIITPGAKGGYGGIAKYNTNIIEFFLKKKNVKKINLFSRSYTKYTNKKIDIHFAKNKILFFLKIFMCQIKIIQSTIIIVSHINLLPFAIIPIIFGKKVILCTYGLEIWGKKKNILYQLIIKKINYFICMREYTKNILKKKYKINYKIFYDLHNAVKFRNFKINKINSKDLITIARLDSSEKYKGIDETLEALSNFKKIDFKYNIVGDGDDKNRLILKAKKLKVLEYVKFFGKINDRKRDTLLSKSKIIIMPGSDKTFDTYPFRFIFLEAAEFGLYIIGSYPPNKKERLYEKKYSSLNFINPKDKIDLTKLIKRLQKKRKIKDMKLIKDFSIRTFEKNLDIIVNKITAK